MNKKNAPTTKQIAAMNIAPDSTFYRRIRFIVFAGNMAGKMKPMMKAKHRDKYVVIRLNSIV